MKHNNNKNYGKMYDNKKNTKEPTPVENVKTEENNNKIGIVKDGPLNIRSKASTDSDVVGTLQKGETVTVIGEENGFYKLENGYCVKKYMTV